tara:strand:- start:459 stop:662 length:204 start_codon:yes stop_codon:yes gene_type:complete
MSVYDDIDQAIRLHDHGPARVSDHGREVLDFIAYHFDLRPLTPDAREAVSHAGSHEARVFKTDTEAD